MAHIPYGYKIERGKAVIVPEEAERIRTFLNAYLDGLSIKNAGAEAEIPLSTSALRKMLSSEVYLGTDYYPPIIDRGTFDEVQRDSAARTHEGQSRPSPVLPMRSLFTLAPPEQSDAGWMNAADAAAYLYSLIRPSDRGRMEMTEEEKLAVAAWRERTQTEM